MYRDTNCFKFGPGSLTNTNIYVFSVTINSRRFFFAIEPQKFAPHSVAQKKGEADLVCGMISSHNFQVACIS